MRILAVDDDPVFLELLTHALAASGYEDVATAGSGQAGLTLAEAGGRGFDCILLDIQMPEMDGIELCRALRASPRHALVPIVMITARGERPYIEAAFAAGATDYLNKPLDPLELRARLRVAARLRQMQRQAERLHDIDAPLRGAVPPASDLAAPRPIRNIEGAIDFLAMENYLLRLSRAGMISKQIVGFHLPHIAELHAGLTAVDFDFMLTDVAEAICDSLKQADRLVAYAGNGNFVAVVDGPAVLDPDALQAAIHDWIATMGVTCPGCDPKLLRVVASAPIELGWSTGRRAAAALHEAMADAEAAAHAGARGPAGAPARPRRLGRLRQILAGE